MVVHGFPKVVSMIFVARHLQHVRTPLHVEQLPGKDGLGGSKGIPDGSSTLQEEDGVNDDRDLHRDPMSAFNLADGQAKVEVRNEEVGLDDVVTSMVVWDNNFDKNVQLLRYWADGEGTPNPLEYHPRLEGLFFAREEELDRCEDMHVAIAQTKLAIKLKELAPPVTPSKPFMPAIFQLKAFDGAVTPLWS